jgi:hypothetical protein
MAKKVNGKLGNFALKNGPEVLIENISNISVTILSINQRVCKLASPDLENKAKNTKSNIVLTKAKEKTRKIIDSNLCNFGFFNSLRSTLSDATAIKGKSDKRLTNKI